MLIDTASMSRANDSERYVEEWAGFVDARVREDDRDE